MRKTLWRSSSLFLLCALGACNPESGQVKSQGQADGAEVTRAPQKAELPALGPAVGKAEARPRKSTAFTLEKGEPIAGTLLAQHVQDGRLFLKVRAPIPNGLTFVSAKIKGPRHGVAVPLAQGGMPEAGLAVVRLVDAHPLSRPLEIEVTLSQRKGNGIVHTVTIPPAEPPQPGDALHAAFYRSAAHWFGAERSGSLLNPYVARRFERIAKGVSDQGPVELDRRRRRRGEISEAMSLYTGMTSIEEALQIDRALGVTTNETPTVSLSNVVPVPLAAHPWPEMIAELKTKPVIEPLAQRVPADMLYAHFDDPKAFAELMDTMEAQLAPVFSAFERQAGRAGISARYQQQLMLQRTELSKILGPQAASSMALVMSDPFLREGSDLSILFEVKGEALLMTAFKGFERRAEAKHGPLKRETISLVGHQVRHTSSSDGVVGQYFVKVDGVIIVSNSAAALTHILKAGQAGVPSLAQAGDFQYMRALYPAKAGEAGFVFLGDAFVAHVVSPQVKVLQARRMKAQAELRAVGYATVVHHWLEGRKPPSIQHLVDMGLLPTNGGQHSDGGKITLTDAGPRSAWGDLSSMTPFIEQKIDLITPSEKAAYDRFRETYQEYWRQFIDPVAVQITQSGGLLSLDVRVLPLIDSSEYDEIIETVGKTTVKVPNLGDGLHWTLAVGQQSKLRRELDSVAKGSGLIGEAGLGWVGDWVAVGAPDTAELWNLVLRTGELSASETRYDDRGEDDNVIRDLPVYAMVHVKSAVALAATLTTLQNRVSGVGMRLRWAPVGQYNGVEIVEIAETGGFFGTFSLYYAIIDDVFVISLNRAVVEGMVDRLSKKARTELPGVPAVQSALNLRPRPNGQLLPTLYATHEASRRRRVFGDWYLIDTLSWMGPLPKQPEDRVALAGHWLGAVPQGWGDGAKDPWQIDDAGVVTHTLYGSPAQPRWPAKPGGDSETTRALSSLLWAFGGIAFEGEGKHQGLRVQIRWAGGEAP
ncbi:MAG: hypothetical protein ACE366_13050 [Bradymonadia bacterium]